MKAKTNKKRPITDYDKNETGFFINTKKTLKFEDLNLKLPSSPPTQVVSIRLPTELLNALRALGSNMDVPYQSLIKIFLSERVQDELEKAS